MELYWIKIFVCEKKGTIKYSNKTDKSEFESHHRHPKLTNFVKLLNCVSFKSSKIGLFRQWEN